MCERILSWSIGGTYVYTIVLAACVAVDVLVCRQILVRGTTLWTGVLRLMTARYEPMSWSVMKAS